MACQPGPPQVHGPVGPHGIGEPPDHEQPDVPGEQAGGERSQGDQVGPGCTVPGSAGTAQLEAENRPDASTVADPSALFNPVHVKFPETSFAFAVSIVTLHSFFIVRKNAVSPPLSTVMTIESAGDVGRVPVKVRPAMPTPCVAFIHRSAKPPGGGA